MQSLGIILQYITPQPHVPYDVRHLHVFLFCWPSMCVKPRRSIVVLSLTPVLDLRSLPTTAASRSPTGSRASAPPVDLT